MYSVGMSTSLENRYLPEPFLLYCGGLGLGLTAHWDLLSYATVSKKYWYCEQHTQN